MDQRELELLVVGALLHDIGKFAQRAGGDKSREIEGDPSDKGRPTHAHVLYTDHFIEQTLPLPRELADEATRSRLARLASSHHKPAGGELLEQAMTVADRLSTGTDRKAGEESEGDFRSARLLSIFEQLSFGGPRHLADLQQGRCHLLAPLSENPFPAPPAEARESDYPVLFADFCGRLPELPLDMGVSHYTAALGSLLEEYT